MFKQETIEAPPTAKMGHLSVAAGPPPRSAREEWELVHSYEDALKWHIKWTPWFTKDMIEGMLKYAYPSEILKEVHDTPILKDHKKDKSEEKKGPQTWAEYAKLHPDPPGEERETQDIPPGPWNGQKTVEEKEQAMRLKKERTIKNDEEDKEALRWLNNLNIKTPENKTPEGKEADHPRTLIEFLEEANKTDKPEASKRELKPL